MNNIFRASVITLTCGFAAWLLIAHHQSRADDKVKPERAVPPEMKVLKKRIGVWTTSHGRGEDRVYTARSIHSGKGPYAAGQRRSDMASAVSSSQVSRFLSSHAALLW